MRIVRLLCCLVIAVFGYSINLSYAWSAPALSISNDEQKRADSIFYFADKEKWQEVEYHARVSREPALKLLAGWMEYRSRGSGARFEDITAFIAAHPDWPDNDLLRQRAEEAITPLTPVSSIVRWFLHNPPVTGDGLKALALAEKNLDAQDKGRYSEKEVNVLLRRAWVQANFGEKEEAEFLAEYGHLLSQDDIHARIDQLLWQRKLDQAGRILALASAGQRRLFNARIAFIKNSKQAESALSAVPKPLYNDAGLLYDRIAWHNRKGEDEKVAKLLASAPPSPPYPHKWWELKNDRIRVLIREQNYQEAYHLAAHHGTEKGEDFAEAEWLSGWLALSFLQQPDIAYKHFYRLYHGVNFPVSLARGAYWAGRAAEKRGDKEVANNWYKAAARHPDSFYGQLAALKLSKSQHLPLPAIPVVTANDKRAYARNLLVRAAYIAGNANRYDLVKKLLKSAVAQARTPGEIRLITETGLALRRQYIAVETAKYAARKGTLVTSTSYPLFAAMPPLPLEQALALAVIRQESSFDQHAESPAGAKGLMQLMPATARGVARELRLHYAENLLKSDHKYNIRLGSYYLSKLIDNFSGSYVLAIASYNGGQGNVRKWLRQYGDPREASTPEEVVDWIEMVPFSETRNYVQRVLENTQIYRQILHKGGAMPSLWLEKDLLRHRKE